MSSSISYSALLSLLILLFLTSCTTYYIPVESFKQQFRGMDDLDMKEVAVQGPMGSKVRHKTYPIKYIHALDNKGNPATIENSPSIEIRFTDTINRRTTFYFDLIQLNKDSITGVQSRLMTSIRKTISLNSIKKIEVQNGKKNFKYVN